MPSRSSSLSAENGSNISDEEADAIPTVASGPPPRHLNCSFVTPSQPAAQHIVPAGAESTSESEYSWGEPYHPVPIHVQVPGSPSPPLPDIYNEVWDPLDSDPEDGDGNLEAEEEEVWDLGPPVPPVPINGLLEWVRERTRRRQEERGVPFPAIPLYGPLEALPEELCACAAPEFVIDPEVSDLSSCRRQIANNLYSVRGPPPNQLNPQYHNYPYLLEIGDGVARVNPRIRERSAQTPDNFNRAQGDPQMISGIHAAPGRCPRCRHLGHAEEECTPSDNSNLNDNANDTNDLPPPPPQNGNGKGRHRY